MSENFRVRRLAVAHSCELDTMENAKNDNPPMRVRHILEYVENGEMVGKDVLEYDVSTDKWHRVEAECIELV